MKNSSAKPKYLTYLFSLVFISISILIIDEILLYFAISINRNSLLVIAALIFFFMISFLFKGKLTKSQNFIIYLVFFLFFEVLSINNSILHILFAYVSVYESNLSTFFLFVKTNNLLVISLFCFTMIALIFLLNFLVAKILKIKLHRKEFLLSYIAAFSIIPLSFFFLFLGNIPGLLQKNPDMYYFDPLFLFNSSYLLPALILYEGFFIMYLRIKKQKLENLTNLFRHIRSQKQQENIKSLRGKLKW